MDRVTKVLLKQKGKCHDGDDVWRYMQRTGFTIENVLTHGLLWRKIGTSNFIFIEHTDDSDGIFIMKIKEVTEIWGEQ